MRNPRFRGGRAAAPGPRKDIVQFAQETSRLGEAQEVYRQVTVSRLPARPSAEPRADMPERRQIDSPWMTWDEACLYTGLSLSSLRRFVWSGLLKPNTVGGSVRFHKDRLDAFMESDPPMPPRRTRPRPLALGPGTAPPASSES